METTTTSRDLISELPDPILHHILSFLDMKYVVMTTFLSTRWAHLWASLPVINVNKEVFELEDVEEVAVGDVVEEALKKIFNEEDIEEEVGDDVDQDVGQADDDEEFEDVVVEEEALKKIFNEEDIEEEVVGEAEDEEFEEVEGEVEHDVSFVDFVDLIMYSRGQSKSKSNIDTFCLSCEDPDVRKDHIDRWIVVAVLRNVQVLDLQINSVSGGFLGLPLIVFTCKSLTTLKLDMHWDMNIVFDVPDEVDLPLLKTLHLISLTLIGGDSTSNFFSKCVALETLVLSKCTLIETNTITISALQLKDLVLDDLYFIDYLNFLEPQLHCRVTLYAPNLTSFRCRDWVLNDYSLVNISSLVTADIDMDLWSDYFTVTDLELPKFFIRDVLKCLQGIHIVRSLTLSVWLLEAVIDVPGGLGNLLTPFSSLRFLKLKTSLSGAQDVALVYFLEKCPNVETLVLEMTKGPRTRHILFDEEIYEAFNLERWEEELLPQWKMCQLKVVEIRDVTAKVNELEFLKFLLKNAAVLEKMFVFTSKKQPPNKRKLKRFSEELMKVPRASSTSSIEFSLG